MPVRLAKRPPGHEKTKAFNNPFWTARSLPASSLLIREAPEKRYISDMSKNVRARAFQLVLYKEKIFPRGRKEREFYPI